MNHLPIVDVIEIAATIAALVWLGWWWVRHGSKG